MATKKTPKQCACGCGDLTKGGTFISGHDSKLYGAIVRHVGGTAELRSIVEKATNKRIKFDPYE